MVIDYMKINSYINFTVCKKINMKTYAVLKMIVCTTHVFSLKGSRQ